MVVVIFVVVFSLIVGFHNLYCKYRHKVPDPYDICVDEYPPFGVRRFTCHGEEIFLHEGVFLWLDLRRRRRSGFDHLHVFIGKDGKPMKDTAETRRKLEQYLTARKMVEAGFQGEVDADKVFMGSIPFAFRRTYFLRRNGS